MWFHNIIINFEIRLSLYNIFLKHLPRMVEKAFVLINTNDQMDDNILLDELKKLMVSLKPIEYVESMIYW